MSLSRCAGRPAGLSGQEAETFALCVIAVGYHDARDEDGFAKAQTDHAGKDPEAEGRVHFECAAVRKPLIMTIWVTAPAAAVFPVTSWRLRLNRVVWSAIHGGFHH